MTRIRAFMSSVERRGRWTVPERLEVRAFWGHVVLDLRDAELTTTTIDVGVLMGNVEIIVPPGMAVDSQRLPRACVIAPPSPHREKRASSSRARCAPATAR